MIVETDDLVYGVPGYGNQTRTGSGIVLKYLSPDGVAKKLRAAWSIQDFNSFFEVIEM
jgi:hypothetical protein